MEQELGKYTLVPADIEADRKTIIDVWRRNLPIQGDADAKYDWQFLDNPYGPGRCWLLCADGVPVGTSAVSMRAFEIGGETVAAAVAGDLAVDKPHRFLGPAVMLQRAVMSCAGAGIRLVFGVPNPQAAAVMKRVSYVEAASLHRYAKVLRPSRYLKRATPFPRLASALGGVADAAYGAFLRFGKPVRRGCTGRLLTAFDSRFDELWNRSRRAHSVIGLRDSRFLRWRFEKCPLLAYRTVGLLSADESRLDGYWIYYLRGEEMVCADLLTAGSEGDLESLLAAVSSHACELGVASISAPCLSLPGPALAAFQRFGFRRRTADDAAPAGKGLPEPRRLMVHSASNSDPVLAGEWYFTPADEDNN